MSDIRKDLHGRTRAMVWNHFTMVQQANSPHPKAICNTCSMSVSGRKERLEAHLLKHKSNSSAIEDEAVPCDDTDVDGSKKRTTGTPIANASGGGSTSKSPEHVIPGSNAISTSTANSSLPTKKMAVKRPHSTLTNRPGAVIITTDEDRKKMQKAWGDFFYSARIPFAAADNKYFHRAIEMTRPGMGNKILNRKMLSDNLLDDAFDAAETSMTEALNGKNVTVSLDGWSDVHRSPMIATSIHCDGVTHPLDTLNTGAVVKTAEYCAEQAVKSIKEAETKYHCTVVGFVSDNEPKMVRARALMEEMLPGLITYGCSAHYLNLVENAGAPPDILSSINAVQRFFREHHYPMALLTQKGGVKPQLPNDTRWSSHEACLETFSRNHALYAEIRDQEGEKKINGRPVIPATIVRFIDNRLLLVEARHLLEIFSILKESMNVFQDDQSTLGDATHHWLKLCNDERLPSATCEEVKSRFKDVSESVIIIAVNQLILLISLSITLCYSFVFQILFKLYHRTLFSYTSQ